MVEFVEVAAFIGFVAGFVASIFSSVVILKKRSEIRGPNPEFASLAWDDLIVAGTVITVSATGYVLGCNLGHLLEKM